MSLYKYIFLFKGKITDDDIENARDQGFSRPKVLILSPFRKFAYEIVHGFIKLIFGDEKKTFVMNLNKFDEEYGDDRNRVHEKRDVAQEYKVRLEKKHSNLLGLYENRWNFNT